MTLCAEEAEARSPQATLSLVLVAFTYTPVTAKKRSPEGFFGPLQLLGVLPAAWASIGSLVFCVVRGCKETFILAAGLVG